MSFLSLITLLPAFSALVAGQYSATYDYNNLPEHTEEGQTGTNACGTTNSQDSNCQTVVVNNLNDFCLWGPPEPNSEVGATEEVEVAYCLNQHGTRTIPEGTLKGVHFVQTPDYLQISGIGDFTSMNIKKGDAGGELDPHGATGFGNPIGGLVFSDAFGQMQQIHEWTSFMSESGFCFRVCNPAGPRAWEYCQHIYDVMGCNWNMPGNYDVGSFDTCLGDSTEPMGVYGSSTFHQGEPQTPEAHQAGATSQCTTIANLAQTIDAPRPQRSSAASSSAEGSSVMSVSSSSVESSSSSELQSSSVEASPSSSVTTEMAGTPISVASQPAMVSSARNNAAASDKPVSSPKPTIVVDNSTSSASKVAQGGALALVAAGVFLF